MRCYNHPQESAITKCERCQKPICLRCRVKINVPIAEGYIRKEYCRECAPKVKSKLRTQKCCICTCGCIAMIGILLFGLIQMSSMG